MSIMEALRQFAGYCLGFGVMAGIVYVLSKLLRCKAATAEITHPKRSACDAVIALVIFAVGAALGLVAARILQEKSPELLKEGSPWRLIFPVFGFACAVVPAVIFVKLRKEPLSTVGLWRRNLWQSLVIGCVLLVPVFLVSGVTPSSVATNFRPHHLVAIAYGFLIGSQEEFLFRGYTQTRMVAWRGRWLGFILTALLFTYFHLPTNMLAKNMGLMDAFIESTVTLPVGLFLGFTMLRTGNLASVLPCHMVGIGIMAIK